MTYVSAGNGKLCFSFEQMYIGGTVIKVFLVVQIRTVLQKHIKKENEDDASVSM